jgi:glycosyltransferase involved in cell wall biosynthesis
LNKKSVVLVIDTLESGGAEKVLIMLSNLLYANGHDVKVICTLNSGSIANQLNSNIKQVALHRKNKFSLFTMYKLVKECSNYEIVHVHSRHNLLYLFVAATIFRLNKKIFFHEHFGDVDINSKVKLYQKIIYTKVKYIAVSKTLQQWALNRVKVLPQNVFLLSNTISVTNVSSSFDVQLNNSKIQLLMVSNFRKSKNIEFAISIAKELKNLHFNFQLTIIGQPVNKDYFNSVKDLIKEFQLEDDVIIATNVYNTQAILHQYHLAIHTSKTESGPLVLLEYMAHALPFVTYFTGDIIDEVKEDFPESIIRDFNIDNWITAIQKVLSLSANDAYRNKLTKVFADKFSIDSYYQKCIKIYNS